MAIEFSCPACRSTLRVEDATAGRMIRCGGCLTLLRVPDDADTVPPPEPTPIRPSNDAPPPHPDDEPSRPRRQRRQRRQRRPPPGRGPLFWVLMVCGVLAISACGCCVGVYLLLPGANWRAHESAQGGFKVDLPARPQRNMQVPGLKADPNLKVEGTVLWTRGELYAVMYEDLPAGLARPNDDTFLNEAVKLIEREGEVRTVVRDEPVSVSGFAGREVEYVASDGGTYVVRLVIAGNRFYRAIGGGRFVDAGNENVRRFLDSFQVTDPKPRPKRAGPK